MYLLFLTVYLRNVFKSSQKSFFFFFFGPFPNLLLQQRKTVADADQDGLSLNHPAIIFRLAKRLTLKRTGWTAEQIVFNKEATCL